MAIIAVGSNDGGAEARKTGAPGFTPCWRSADLPNPTLRASGPYWSFRGLGNGFVLSMTSRRHRCPQASLPTAFP